VRHPGPLFTSGRFAPGLDGGTNEAAGSAHRPPADPEPAKAGWASSPGTSVAENDLKALNHG